MNVKIEQGKIKMFYFRNKIFYYNLVDVYVQVNFLVLYKFVGDNFYGLLDFFVFDIILWIFLFKWMDKNCILYIVGDVNVLLRGIK